MKCAFCVEAGLRSKVYTSGYGCVTLMASYEFYDEDGRHHSHNPNTRTQEYRCSNLHNWSMSVRGGCCDDDPCEEKVQREPDSFRCSVCLEVNMHDAECPGRAADTEHRAIVFRLAGTPKPWLKETLGA